MNTKTRVCLLMLDSLGIGASLDAGRYGDKGANTLLHIYEACEQGLCDQKGLRFGPLKLPNLTKRGLYHALVASSGTKVIDLSALPPPQAHYGYGVEQSLGKDTPSGHWELAGVPLDFDWGYFPRTIPCFPPKLIEAFIKEAKLPGVLGEKHASGTEIIEELGLEHLRTGKPIVYASGDSVFQIAAHEEAFGLSRLYEICEVARTLVDPYQIGRVIARPFVGEPGTFKRTSQRRDYTSPPPQPTLLDHLKEASREVIAIGKIADIYAHRGMTQTLKGSDNMDLFTVMLKAFKKAPTGSLTFTNFVDFDSMYGHRRDLIGYAKALEDFDERLPELDAQLKAHDLVLITADHGCDPSFPGSDHTREHIPIIAYTSSHAGRFIGRRESFADIGQSIAEYLGISSLTKGLSFLYDLH